jgi:hypothetical protein
MRWAKPSSCASATWPRPPDRSSSVPAAPRAQPSLRHGRCSWQRPCFLPGGSAAMFNVDASSALVDHFRCEMADDTVVVSTGTRYIPSPIYQASSDPRIEATVGNPGEGCGEIEIQNRLGVQVSAVGNRYLDTGPAGFADIIAPDGAYQVAVFPRLAANIDFTADTATAPLVVVGAQEASALPGPTVAAAGRSRTSASRGSSLQAGFDAIEPGLSDFSETGSEQDALAEYLTNKVRSRERSEPRSEPVVGRARGRGITGRA